MLAIKAIPRHIQSVMNQPRMRRRLYLIAMVLLFLGTARIVNAACLDCDGDGNYNFCDSSCLCRTQQSRWGGQFTASPFCWGGLNYCFWPACGPEPTLEGGCGAQTG